MENYSFKNCTDEAIIKMIGKITLQFDEFKDLEKQRQLKTTLEESLYGYDITSQSKELICSDLDEKINTYLLVRKIEGIADKTIYNYKLILNKFADCFSTKTISMITSMDIRYFLALYKKENDVKNSTLNSFIFCLKKFFAYLIDNDVIIKNPMNQIKEIKVEKRLKKIMTDEQLEILKINCKNIKEKLLVEFAVSTGCRISEIANANIDNINWNEKSISIIGKGNKERIVYFNTKTKLLLEKYLKDRKEFDEHKALFLSDKFPYQRIKSRALQLILSNIKTEANLQDYEYITMHGFRRKFATNNISHGMKLEYIQKILGHSNPETTLIYARISDKNIKSAYDMCTY